MPFSHHSHSGQFCPGHAKDKLEDIVLTAIAKKMKVFALTEHMPRHEADHYPEEVGTGATLESAYINEDAFVTEARRLQDKYASQIELLVGFESEWCGHRSLNLVERSLSKHQYDFFIGSIHHVKGIPIDYDDAFYCKARDNVGGSEEKLFETYFDEQYEMLQCLKPLVVGHLDLIRLKSSNFNTNFKRMQTVWTRIERNLDFISSYGGMLEINTAALRKGMDEPYPNSEICQAWLSRQGRFCLSDDSHGIDQVATNYHKLLPFLKKNGINTIGHLQYRPFSSNDDRFPNIQAQDISITELEKMHFWT